MIKLNEPYQFHHQYLLKNGEYLSSDNIYFSLKNCELHNESGYSFKSYLGVGYHIDGKLCRSDGPAAIWNDGREYWILNGHDITSEVDIWIKENSLPYWTDWTADHKLLFKLTFG